MATSDEALAELRAARAALYEASSTRDRLILSRTRVLSQIADANAQISACRDRVNAARAAVIAALQTEGPALVVANEVGAGETVNTAEGP